MSNITKIVEVEDALIDLMKAQMEGVTNIGPLTSEDFADDDSIVTETPAVRMFFSSEDFSSMDNRATIYGSSQNWVMLFGAQDLRGKDEERKGAYELVSKGCEILAGARLTIESHPQKPIVRLARARLAQSNQDGTWYALELVTENSHEFDGLVAE